MPKVGHGLLKFGNHPFRANGKTVKGSPEQHVRKPIQNNNISPFPRPISRTLPPGDHAVGVGAVSVGDGWRLQGRGAVHGGPSWLPRLR